MATTLLRPRALTTAAAAAALAALSGCTPEIDDVTVGTGEPGEQLAVSAAITKNQTTIQGVELQTRPVGGDYGSGLPMAGSGGNYSGQTPRLGPGDFEARVNVRYLRMMLPGEQTRSSAAVPFSLAWPVGTFSFEGGLSGWTYQGVFRTTPAFQQCDVATLTSFPQFHAIAAGWPIGIGNTNPGFPAGALRAAVNTVCYPDQLNEVDASGQWQFNFRSPDLSGDPNWQNINGVSFRLFSTVPGVSAQATVIFDNGDGTDGFASPPDSPGNPAFATVGAAWEIVERTGYIPGNPPIKGVLIRVFGQPEAIQGITGAEVVLDVVAPIP